MSMFVLMHIDLAVSILDQAIKHIEDAQSVKAELIDENADILTIYGSCVFSKARLATHKNDDSVAKPLLDKAIEILVKAESMQDEEGDYKTLETVRHRETSS